MSDQLYDENRELLLRARHHYPDQPEIRLELALALSDRGDQEEAKGEARHAAELSGGQPFTQLRCAYLLLNLGDLESARDLIVRINESTSATWEFAFQLIHLGGRVAGQQGHDEPAEKLLANAFEGEPDYPGHGWYLAKLYLDQGRFSEALAVVTDALRHRPGDLALQALKKEISQDCRGG